MLLPFTQKRILDLKYVKCCTESVALKQIIFQLLDEFMSVMQRIEIKSVEKHIILVP